MDPSVAHFQTLLATFSARFYVSNLVHVTAGLRFHLVSYLTLPFLNSEQYLDGRTSHGDSKQAGDLMRHNIFVSGIQRGPKSVRSTCLPTPLTASSMLP